MLLHGLGGVLLLGVIVAINVWRALQRYNWRKNAPRQVQWNYLLIGIVMFGILYFHRTLGAQLGEEFSIHATAAKLLQEGANPHLLLK